MPNTDVQENQFIKMKKLPKSKAKRDDEKPCLLNGYPIPSWVLKGPLAPKTKASLVGGKPSEKY